MTISDLDKTAASAALNAINEALAAYDTKGGPTAKDIFAASTLLPAINAARGLALGLGNALYDEQLAAAKAALDPFVGSTAERDYIAAGLSLPKKLLSWTNGLAESGGESPSEAPNRARLLAAILTRVLGAVA